MEFVNLTPHAITIAQRDESQEVRVINSIPPSGAVARVAAETIPCGDCGGIPLCRVAFGAIEHLPEPKEGVTYIVSMLVGQALLGSGRTDVVGPDTNRAFRDAKGGIIGVPALVQY